MITLPEYTVMGEDGHEYGPVYAEQIAAWIAEERLEKKTPVKPPQAKDWVFLGSLPEFAGAFEKAAQAPPHPARRRAGKRFLVVALAVVALLLILAVKVFRMSR